MGIDADTVLAQVNALVDEYRTRCLWFWRADYYPATRSEALQALGYIERHGDVAALRRVAPLKQWLLASSCNQAVPTIHPSPHHQSSRQPVRRHWLVRSCSTAGMLV